MWIAIILISLVVVGAVGIFIIPNLLLPPMLRSVTAGGQGDPCHPDPLWENMPAESPSRPRGSPELNERLEREFPQGSSEENLIRALYRRGFKELAKCENDQSIRRAWFHRVFPIEMNVVVYWKTDPQNALVWTRGHVWYTFL
jgi:hypothetical protein